LILQKLKKKINKTEMDILKREMAPVTDTAWKEIANQTDTVLTNYLTARKFVDIDGPNGFDFSAVSTGRLTVPKKKMKDGVNYGIRSILPLVEVRKPFELDLWELDNINRGAKDVDLEPLENAVKQIAGFEENTIYMGLSEAGINGLSENNHYGQVFLPDKVENIIKFIGAQINVLQRNAVEGPYTLVLTEKYWLELINLVDGYPLIKQLTELLGGKIIINDHCDKSFLVSERGGDFELTLGQDVSVGYEAHDTQKVKLYLTESFTFRILSPEAIVVISSKKTA
jgi:uncharacterized linocin/CFP29 family protein